MTIKDHFSKTSVDYARYRPGYPEELFDWLASLTPARELAWDVGTGNGQAAIGLARRFRRVIATDPAAAQIRSAVAHERVTYKIMSAERTDIEDAAVDLVAVAQALHWFDFDGFYGEAKRVLKPGGVIAAWTYALLEISPPVDEILRRYYSETVGRYWPPERRHVDQGYRTIPFPFEAIKAPAMRMQLRWDLEDLFGYLGTWSAAQRYLETEGHDPLDTVREALARAWGEARTMRDISWPVYWRVGRLAHA